MSIYGLMDRLSLLKADDRDKIAALRSGVPSKGQPSLRTFNATKIIKDGQKIRVNGTSGYAEIL